MQTRAEIVVQSAQSRIGHPYVFGAWGEDCTPANRRKRIRADKPNIVSKCPVLSGKASACSGCKYQGTCIYDCRGFTYRCLMDAGIKIVGEGATAQYNTSSNWLARGTTDSLPDCVCCLFKYSGGRMTHTGLHIGGGKIIHCSGEVKTGIVDKSWTHWAIPIGLYDAVPERRITIMSTLKIGSKGENVTRLQTNLNQLGYNCGTPDGKYGSMTAAAVRMFQGDYGLAVDGIAGALTQNALAEILARRTEAETKPAPFVVTGATIEDRLTAIENYLADWSKKMLG